MPSTLDTTPGAITANAYCTRVEADAYHDNLPRADVRLQWTAVADADKDRAILSATLLIDRAFEWVGTRGTMTQALEWPRYVFGDFYGFGGPASGYGPSLGAVSFYIDPHTIPDRVKQATAEYARQLLVEDRTHDSEVGNQGIKSLKADVIEIEFLPGQTSKPIPDAVALLLSGLGYAHGWGTNTVKLVRV